MSSHQRPTTGTEGEDRIPPHYEVRLDGRLAPRWAARFDGFTVTGTDDAGGTTVIRGPIVDQAALHGLLGRLRDLGIPLRSLTRVEAHAPDTDHPDPDDPSGASR